jgi:hypothetical protein
LGFIISFLALGFSLNPQTFEVSFCKKSSSRSRSRIGRNTDLVVMARLRRDEAGEMKRGLLSEPVLEFALASLFDENASLRLIMGLAYSTPQLLLLLS